MVEGWVRMQLTAKLLSDAHFGTGAGGNGVDALVARDREGRPVIWASHVEGVLRDAAFRIRDQAGIDFFGHGGGKAQKAIFSSLYATNSPETRVWRATARASFDDRAPKEDTLRVVECVPKGTTFLGEVELPETQLPILDRLVLEVDALGSQRATGTGRVKLALTRLMPARREFEASTGRLLLLLKNRDPLCITATATPDNLIPSLAFVPGRAVLGTLASWLMAEGQKDIAAVLTSERISVSDALPLPHEPAQIDAVEVLPAPLSLKSVKPEGSAGDVPWWALEKAPVRRFDAWSDEAKEAQEKGIKLKRPEDDLFVFRASRNDSWTSFRPVRRIRLRNGRPKPKQPEPSLFAVEQIVENTYFLAEIRGPIDAMACVAKGLAPVLEGWRWLRLGRGGAPVEVAKLAWVDDREPNSVQGDALLTLTSDLLVRDEHLRWRTALDEASLRALLGVEGLGVTEAAQDSVMIHGFNGTSRLWRMPAAAIRRGSVFAISGDGVAKLAENAARGERLGERTHEGFGTFRIDPSLPGVTNGGQKRVESAGENDFDEEVIAAATKNWFEKAKELAGPDSASARKPSLSQWLDLVSALERGDQRAIEDRLAPTTAGARGWKHLKAREVLLKLKALPSDRARYARFFVRWLRAEMRTRKA